MLDDELPRPLDARERRMLDEIARAIRRDDPELLRLLEGTGGIVHPPIRRTGTRLTWRVVTVVMLPVVLYAAVLAHLPPAVLFTAVLGVQLVLIPVGCLLWARRHREL